MSFQKGLAIPDTHRPFHDKIAWSLALNVGKCFFKGTPKKDRKLIAMGDFVDCAAISRFPKKNRMPFEHEIADGKDGIEDLKSLQADEEVFIEGNHEDRWPTYIATHAAEAAELIPSMRTMLGLQDWTYVKYHDSFYWADAEFTHDTGSYGSTAHKTAMQEAGGKIFIGHTHWAGIEYRSRRDKSTYFGTALGCLADKKQIDYQSRVKTTNWTLGVGLVYNVDGVVHVNYCPFLGTGNNLHAVVEGTIVRPSRSHSR